MHLSLCDAEVPTNEDGDRRRKDRTTVYPAQPAELKGKFMRFLRWSSSNARTGSSPAPFGFGTEVYASCRISKWRARYQRTGHIERHEQPVEY